MLLAKAPMKMVERKTPLDRMRVLLKVLVAVLQGQCSSAGGERILVDTTENASHYVDICEESW